MYKFVGSAHGYRSMQTGNIVFAIGTPHDVDLQQPPALAYWCRHFKTTPERLFAAVKRVGTNPSVVRKTLLEKA